MFQILIVGNYQYSVARKGNTVVKYQKNFSGKVPFEIQALVMLKRRSCFHEDELFDRVRLFCRMTSLLGDPFQEEELKRGTLVTLLDGFNLASILAPAPFFIMPKF